MGSYFGLCGHLGGCVDGPSEYDHAVRFMSKELVVEFHDAWMG